MVALYYRPYGGTTWQDVSDYIGNKGLVSWSQELGVNLLEFKFTLENPLDESSDPLIIEVGDDFVLCPDTNRNFVLGNCAGVVINNGKKMIAWDMKNDRPFLKFDITVRQRDFSKDIATFEYKEDTSLSTIIEDILNTHTNEQIGGYLSLSSQAIPKYELLAPDITISSFDFNGKALKALKQLLDSIGLYFRIDYYVEQNSTTTLNLVGKVVIFNASGVPSNGVWSEGITNDTVKRGFITNPYYIDSSTTPEQPVILWGENSLDIDTDFESTKNYFNFIALVQDGLNLTREDFTQTNLENFKLANKAKDIIYVARLIKDYVATVTSTTIFTLPLGSSQKLAYDQQRLIDNNLGGQMVCKITSSGTEYIRVFTISGQTVTLAQAISSLSVNDTFELINSYDILEENRDSYPVDGYVIKHVRYDENGEIKFPKYDKPNPADTVVVHYYALADYVKESYFEDSIQKYGLFDFDLDVDYPLVTGQLELIHNQFYKYVNPLQTIKFKSLRPEPLSAGNSLGIDVTNIATGQFIVNSIDCKLIANKAYKNKYTLPDKKNNLLIEQTVELASYRDSLTEIIAGFKPKLYNKTAIVDNKVDYRNLAELQIFSQFSPGTATIEQNAYIAYISNKVTRDYNYLTDFTKSFDTKISSNSTRDERGWGTGKFSHDGRYYAYDVDFYGSGNYQIFIRDFVTDTDIQITADNTNTYSSPCWNPNDPNYVYFIRNIAATSGNDTLCKAPIDGSGTIAAIRNISNGYYAYNGMFDPAGTYFIWCGLSNAGATNFYIASLPANDLVGGSITNLETNTASSNYFYIFVGTTKVYYRKLVSGVYQIHDMTLAGGSKTQRTTGAGNKSNPVVSPDESQILYDIISGSDRYILSADTTPDMSGYYTNTQTWLNNTGNLTELASDWNYVIGV